MKSNRSNRFLGLLCRFFSASAIVMSFFGLAQAATLYYDGATAVANGQSNNATTTAQNWLSGGTWDNGTTSAARASWTAGDAAVFGGVTTASTQTITAGTLTVGNMTFGGGTAGTGTVGKAYTITGGTLTLSSSTITANTNTTISSALAGTTGLIKAGGTFLVLSGSHSGLSGTTTINAGSITMNTATNTTAIVVNSGGQFYGGWAIPGNNFANTFSISGTGWVEGGINNAAIRASNNQTFSGPITLAAASRIGMIETSAASTFSGKISGAFALNVQGAFNGNAGTQTFTLANAGVASDYTGDLSISAVDYGGARTGAKTILRLGADDQIPHGVGKGNLVLSGANAEHQTIFELNGKNETINGLSNASAAGAIIRNTVSGASVLTIGDADAIGSFSGVISDGGDGKTLAITKIGTAALTLGGVNTYTGPTTINAGTLVIDATGAAATTDIVVKNTTALQVNAAGKTLQRLSLEDGSKLTLPVAPAQTVTITNDLDLSATPTNFTVKPVFPGTAAAGSYDLLTPGSIPNLGNLGTITLDTSGLVGRVAASAATFMSGGKLVLTVGIGPASLVWDNVAGFGTGKWSVETPADNNFKNGASDDMFYNADSVTFGDTSAGTVSLVGTLSPAAITVNSASNYTFTGSGSLAGSTGLVKSGSGALTIETANTFTGPTSLSLGTLTAASSGALGASPITVNGGTLNLNAAGAATPGTVTLNGGTLAIGDAAAFTAAPAVLFGSASTGKIQLNGNNLTLTSLNTTGFSSTPMVENGVDGTATLTVNNAAASAYYGVLRNGTAGTLALIKAGTGALTLGGTNSYTGTTTVSAGILNLNAMAPTVLGGFVMNGPDQTFTRPQQAGQFGPGVVASFTSAANAWNRFEFFGKDQAFAGITTGNLTTQGGGVLQNSETNGQAGANATLLLNGDSADPSYPAGGYLFNGHVRDHGANTAGTHPLALVKSGSGTQTLVGNVIVYSGPTTVAGGTLVFSKTNTIRSVAINNSAIVEMNSVTGDDWIAVANPVLSGAGTWNKTGAGRATFNNATVIATGQFNIQAGTLRNNNNAANWSGSTADIDITDGAILDLYADSIFVDQLTQSGVGSAFVQNAYGNATGQSGAAANYEKLVVGVAGGTSEFAGVIRDNPTNTPPAATTAGGGIDLQKVGSGVFTLSGANLYTGPTTVTGGTLALMGGAAIKDGNTITLDNTAGAQLRLDTNETVEAVTGGGAIGGSIDLQGNVLTLGTLNSSSTFAGAIGGTGGITKSGTGILTLSGTGSYTGTTTVAAGTLALSGTGASPIALNAGILLLTGTTTGALAAATGTTLSGEGTAGATTLGVDTGSVTTLVADPATPGALTVGGLTLNGKVSVSLSNGIFSPGVPFTVVKFDTNDSGFIDTDVQLVGGGSYRAPTFVVDEVSIPNKVTLSMGSLDLTWNNNAGGGIWDNSTFNFRSGGADSDFKWGDFVTFNDAANPVGPTPSGVQAINIAGTQQPAWVTITGAANDYTFSGAGKISGFTGLTKSGTSTARFNQTNDYTGGTAVTGGTLEANAAGALGTGTITVNGGTLNAMFAGALGSAPVTLTTGTLNVTIASGLGTGIVTVSGGTMNASATNALSGSTVNLAGGTLVVNNATTPFGTATVAAKGGTIQYATGMSADVSSTLKNGTSPIRVDTNNNNVTWATALPVTNTAGLTKVGTGTLTLTGSSPFTGDITIQGGAISFATVAVVGTASPPWRRQHGRDRPDLRRRHAAVHRCGDEQHHLQPQDQAQCWRRHA